MAARSSWTSTSTTIRTLLPIWWQCKMQAALAVVRCRPVEPYTPPTDEPSVVALAEVEQLRAKLLAKRHALYADNLSNAIADA